MPRKRIRKSAGSVGRSAAQKASQLKAVKASAEKRRRKAMSAAQRSDAWGYRTLSRDAKLLENRANVLEGALRGAIPSGKLGIRARPKKSAATKVVPKKPIRAAAIKRSIPKSPKEIYPGEAKAFKKFLAKKGK